MSILPPEGFQGWGTISHHKQSCAHCKDVCRGVSAVSFPSLLSPLDLWICMRQSRSEGEFSSSIHVYACDGAGGHAAKGTPCSRQDLCPSSSPSGRDAITRDALSQASEVGVT